MSSSRVSLWCSPVAVDPISRATYLVGDMVGDRLCVVVIHRVREVVYKLGQHEAQDSGQV